MTTAEWPALRRHEPALLRRAPHGPEYAPPHPMTEPAVTVRELGDCWLADYVRALVGPAVDYYKEAL